MIKNIANITVLIRVFLVFIVIALLSGSNQSLRLLSVPLLLCALLLDGFDGYLARRLQVVSDVGGILNTLGDRLTENVLIFYLTYMRLLPFWFAAFFLVRSFLADFIRGLNFNRGITTFSINRSLAGRFLVSSGSSRISYLLAKFCLFIFGGLILAVDYPLPAIVVAVRCLYWFVFLFSMVRFLLLLYDSRFVLKESFHANNE